MTDQMVTWDNTTIHLQTIPGSLPTGIICMWSGLLSNIPAGWQLCDGTNGTPDLTNKFIKCVGSGENPGGTGGSATLTHSGTAVDAHASHTHPFGTLVFNGNQVTSLAGTQHTHAVGTTAITPTTHASQGGHTHDSHTTASSKYGTATGNPLIGPTTHSNQGAHTHDNHGLTWGPANESAHTHAVTATGSISGSTGNESASLTHSVTQPSNHTGVEPVYFKLAYIMKL